MPVFEVKTPNAAYPVAVQRGVLSQTADYLPRKAGKLFAVSTEDVWRHQGALLHASLQGTAYELLHLPGGENTKRMGPLEAAAEEMVRRGADRSSVIIAFGGGIVGDMAGFLAAIFMRGIPVLQAPTTLLAQVDAAIGGKTGVNLAGGKNLVGAFHQPVAVLCDPDVLQTLPEREYHAGLFEVIKYGVIRSPRLFHLLQERRHDVLAKRVDVLEDIIAESVKIKADVVNADERESGVRRILNFGHTVGHALEAETEYRHFLHGEAVAVGMLAVAYLGEYEGTVSPEDAERIRKLVRCYGPWPATSGIDPARVLARLVSDKKTIQGKVHFVLPSGIGDVVVTSEVNARNVPRAIEAALA